MKGTKVSCSLTFSISSLSPSLAHYKKLCHGYPILLWNPLTKPTHQKVDCDDFNAMHSGLQLVGATFIITPQEYC